MIRITATASGLLLEKNSLIVRAAAHFTVDQLFTAANPGAAAAAAFARGTPVAARNGDSLRARCLRSPTASFARTRFPTVVT